MRFGLFAAGSLLGIGVCTSAMAQAMPGAPVKREFHVEGTANLAYDSNSAHSSAALAAQRGIQLEDETFHPALNFTLVEPIGRQSIYVNGAAGYDFHRYNSRLNRRSRPSWPATIEVPAKAGSESNSRTRIVLCRVGL